MRKFRSKWGSIVTIDELREEYWPVMLGVEGLTEEEYPFEKYLHDCLSKNGGAFTEIKDHKDRKVLVAVSIFLLACVIVLITGIVGANAETMYVAVNEESHLNARSAPINGDIEAKLLRGWEVEVLSIEDGWAKITGYGESDICYVNSEYLSKEMPSDVEKCEPMVYTITTDKVRLRESPNGKKIRWLYEGNQVTVIGWVMVDDICWARTNTGYVMAEYLDK